MNEAFSFFYGCNEDHIYVESDVRSHSHSGSHVRSHIDTYAPTLQKVKLWVSSLISLINEGDERDPIISLNSKFNNSRRKLMWSEEEIIEIMRTGEHINLECKEAGNAIPNDVWETYSAFANTYGGIILLGVRENLKEKNPKKRFILTGVNNPSQRMKDFWDSVNNNEKVNRNLLIDQDVKPVQFKDGPCIIVIHVPAADYSEKPVFINKNPYFGTYRRNFEGDYHCKEEEVKSMIRDSSDEPSDSLLLQNYGMEDVDLDTVCTGLTEQDSGPSGAGFRYRGAENFLPLEAELPGTGTGQFEHFGLEILNFQLCDLASSPTESAGRFSHLYLIRNYLKGELTALGQLALLSSFL